MIMGREQIVSMQKHSRLLVAYPAVELAVWPACSANRGTASKPARAGPGWAVGGTTEAEMQMYALDKVGHGWLAGLEGAGVELS